MAFEIVDGMTGTKHISSDDLSALNVATIGKADCVLNYGDNFKMTMTNANTATLGTGVGMVGGKRFWNQAATSLTIQSGTQGQKRNDLVVARYAKTSAGIESITPVVIKGTTTTGTAADPEVTANDLKLWRVPLDGISVGEPVKLFEPVASLATLGDSVSHYKGQYGWHIVEIGGAKICAYSYDIALFAGGNEYARFTEVPLPDGLFTEAPHVVVCKKQTGNSIVEVRVHMNVSSVSTDSVHISINDGLGGIPDAVRVPFTLLAIGW